jgi:hypothetical protein
MLFDEHADIEPEPCAIDDRQISVFPPATIELDPSDPTLTAQTIGDVGEKGAKVNPALAPKRLFRRAAEEQPYAVGYTRNVELPR